MLSHLQSASRSVGSCFIVGCSSDDDWVNDWERIDVEFPSLFATQGGVDGDAVLKIQKDMFWQVI